MNADTPSAPSRLLHIAASPMGERSQSRAVAETLVTAYRRTRPHATTDVLDLWRERLPEFGAAAVGAKRTEAAGGRADGEGAVAWKEVRRVFEHFDSYDRYVFSVPMWNFGIPYVLKHFIDVVSQAHMLFSFDRESGYRGLLRGKKAAVVYTSSVYGPGMPTEFGDDHQTPAFDGWLRWAGITDISTIQLRAQQIADDADVLRRDAHARAQEIGRRF
ncbi:NAD(P)H-dependent oxidoreductase [Streptomyces scabiei]|uniref:FMN-dependent NADH-azoreductase n=1 Tax=Streptomyces scabiei TaxID=1930 RepID=UPI001B314123|nr:MULTISPECIES: NAD(P)H-dependent oxidoreductase [Streptomyces]MBP5888499.1 flavodoxin family protein [Streptomyces sp. LBUM 1487]MBP5904527.1 flavodoxin family protein [Streptomyces sp. LBUM 1488]MDW8478215.1 NAD(P)H-dependent oxidoreductase [Streptomyces scabiei]MDX2565821.1 NAD(P)H-dependent oxidoreductase [Streptomyces scabiei]MDX2625064.1 NAD(P)H-dependent oxidoreductase [Streptomyces scabiei]